MSAGAGSVRFALAVVCHSEQGSVMRLRRTERCRGTCCSLPTEKQVSRLHKITRKRVILLARNDR